MARAKAAPDPIEDIMADVNKALGVQALRRASDPAYVVTYIPTGLLPMDILLQGGIPRGRFTVLTGDWSTLKSYVGYNAIKECQQAGGIAGLIDTERAFDPLWAQHIGIDVDRLMIYPPRDSDITVSGELAIDAAEVMVRKGFDLIVFDSVAAALPEAERKKRLHDESTQPARLAALMSAASRKLTAANNKTAVLWINQLREQVGIVFGNPEKMTGGRALPYYSCLAPGTKVLTADYQWVPIETLNPGDKIVGFDEYNLPGERRRKMRVAEVEANDPVMLPSYQITTESGETVASEHHKWLVKGGYPSKPELVWKETCELQDGDEIAWFAEPWDQSDTYEAAYLSGLYDGEGSVNTGMWTKSDNYKGWGITLVQKPGVVLDKAKAYLDVLGYRYREDVQKATGCHVLTLSGDLADRMRFFGEVRPERLVNRIGSGWEGSAAVSAGPGYGRRFVTVKGVEYLGKRKVYAIGTSTETLMANGMFSHNSYIVQIKKTGKISRDIKMFTGEKWQSGKEQIGQQFKAEVQKSKLNKPFREIWFNWSLEQSQIDLVSFVNAQGVELGLVKIKGNTWSYGSHKAVGRTKWLAKVASTPALFQALETAVRDAHGLPVKTDPSGSRKKTLRKRS